MVSKVQLGMIIHGANLPEDVPSPSDRDDFHELERSVCASDTFSLGENGLLRARENECRDCPTPYTQ